MKFLKNGLLIAFFFTLALNSMEERPQTESLKRKREEKQETEAVKRAKVIELSTRDLWDFFDTREKFVESMGQIFKNQKELRAESADFLLACTLIAFNGSIYDLPADENFKDYIKDVKYHINRKLLYERIAQLIGKNRTAKEQSFLLDNIKKIPALNISSKSNNTLLIKAVFARDNIGLLCLTSGFVNFNIQDITALIEALSNGDLQTIKTLLQEIADPSIINIQDEPIPLNHRSKILIMLARALIDIKYHLKMKTSRASIAKLDT